MKRLLPLALLLALPAIAQSQPMRATMKPAMAKPAMMKSKVKPMARAKAKAPAMAPKAKAMTAPMVVAKKASVPPMAAAPAKKVSKLEKATKWIEIIGGIIVGLLTLIGGILTAIKGVDWRKGMKGKRWDKIQYYADKAFDAVEGVAGMTSWKGDDKIVEYLKRINLWLKGEGKKPLNDSEEEAVKLAASDTAATRKAKSKGTEKGSD